MQTKQALLMAEKELEVRSSLTPSLELQRWLQITYELELKAYNEKKGLAEQQLLNAKVCTAAAVDTYLHVYIISLLMSVAYF